LQVVRCADELPETFGALRAAAKDRRRLRHFYVHPDWRRGGVGRTLAGALAQQGLALAPTITLRATHDVSRAFWEAMGFSRVTHPTRSHELRRP
jgi:GNAT superfamily N-acetyltransferase